MYFTISWDIDAQDAKIGECSGRSELRHRVWQDKRSYDSLVCLCNALLSQQSFVRAWFSLKNDSRRTIKVTFEQLLRLPRWTSIVFLMASECSRSSLYQSFNCSRAATSSTSMPQLQCYRTEICWPQTMAIMQLQIAPTPYVHASIISKAGGQMDIYHC